MVAICEVCKRRVEAGEEFVLSGIYPARIGK